MPSLQTKYTFALEKPQFYYNKYSNTYINAFTSTQTYSPNTPIYHPSCFFSIFITNRCGKPPFSLELCCLTTWPLTFSQSFAVVTLVQTLFCQTTRTFSISLKLNIALNIAHPITVLKTTNIGYIWKYSYLNFLATINFTLPFSYDWYIPILSLYSTLSICFFYPK